ncbi:MAG: SUMF1/EgtB/PvdO family nonheme iron enzyme [Akkermansiaceae bacterium]|nr:SUMF1/EgtB/PvdO family nonheme iron enzyme [Akkermansiaceae bacterium]
MEWWVMIFGGLMRFPLLSVCVAMVLAIGCSYAQTVGNVRAAQRAGTKLVDVYYDLGGDDGPYRVAFEGSADGGATWTLPLATVIGAMGSEVAAGANRRAVWDAGADWNGNVSEAVRFRVRATKDAPVTGEFSLIPAGNFQMGDSVEETGGELPVHTVYVSAFYMGRYEVTKSLWDEVRAWGLNNGYTDLGIGSHYGDTNYSKGSHHPVHVITWYDVVKWCNARSEKAGLAPCYRVGGEVYRTGNNTPDCSWYASGYRLPTEAEWEKSARGGLNGARYPWGNTISHALANYWADFGQLGDQSNGGAHPAYSTNGEPYTSPVGSLASNGYGLYDMAGNVAEWCWDWWEPYEASPRSDPRSSALSDFTGFRVIRGGAWDRSSELCRVSSRNYFDSPDGFNASLGFRLARGAGVLGNITTVDTRRSFTITGRILDGNWPYPPPPLEGVTVSVGSVGVVTGADGMFELKVDPLAGGVFKAAKEGFMDYLDPLHVEVRENTKVDLGLIELKPETDAPYVEWLQPDPDGFLLWKCGLRCTAKAKVNWNGHRPESVQFFANGVLVETLDGSGPEYEATISVDEHFTPSIQFDANSISVVATGIPEEGGMEPVASEEEVRNVYVFLSPKALESFLSPENISTELHTVKIKVKFPAPAIGDSVTLPVIGTLGGKVQSEGELSYHIPSGQWVLSFGKDVENPLATLNVGKVSASTGFHFSGTGTASPTKGFTLDGVTMEPRFNISGQFRLGTFGPLDLLAPGISNVLGRIPRLRESLDNVVIVVMLKPNVEGRLAMGLWPEFKLKSGELTGRLPLEAFYEPKVFNVKARFYVGGEPRITFKIPGDFLKEVGVRAYAGLYVSKWGMQVVDLQYVFVDYPSSGARGSSVRHARSPANVLEAAGNAMRDVRPMERQWRAKGAEKFVAGGAGELGSFNRMGRSGAGVNPGGRIPRMIVNDPDMPVGAELPLLENVFPEAEPALAGRDHSSMLLYVRDTGEDHPLQFTEIAWTRYDGTSWSVPEAVAPAPNGQFSPQVVFDGNGDAIAVWEQFKDPAFSEGDLEETASQIEIMWSRWSSATGTWTVPVAMTSNAVVDHQPRLSGPLADGGAVLTWIRNQGNKLAGEGAEGAVTNNEVQVTRWDAATKTWQTPQTLAANLTGDTSHSLAAGGDKAVFVWGRDMDGDTAESADSELFARVMDADGNWAAPIRLTHDAFSDLNARVAVDTAGEIHMVWNRNGDLVAQRNLEGAITVVREETDSMGAADFSLAIGPSGNLLVIWQDMTETGSDVHCRVFDPVSDTWGLDTRLSDDRDLETSFAPVWDAAGNLTMAYLNVAITDETKAVTMEGGEVVEVEGVPQPGRVDLLVAKRALVKDLAVAPDGLSAEGGDFLPGDAVTLKAKIRNTGNVAVEDAVVAFYDGNPEEGGTLIGTATVPGWLKASDDAEVTVGWMIPEPAVARMVFAVVDPDGVVAESDEENNMLSLPLNGVNLQVEYQSGRVLRDGSARVLVKVRNLSAPESPVSTLQLKERESGVVLVEKVVSQVAPGEVLEFPLDLPAGSHPEGAKSYVVTVDGESLSGDVDTGNNEIQFSLLLWIDDDRDGLPRWWEEANGLSDSDPADSNLDSDGDGFSNRHEYLAGTDPRNSSSMLRVGEIAQRPIENGGGVSVSWVPTPGRRYKLERSYDLRNWTMIVEDVEASPPLNTVVDGDVPPDGKAFYRLTVLETSAIE